MKRYNSKGEEDSLGNLVEFSELADACNEVEVLKQKLDKERTDNLNESARLVGIWNALEKALLEIKEERDLAQDSVKNLVNALKILEDNVKRRDMQLWHEEAKVEDISRDLAEMTRQRDECADYAAANLRYKAERDVLRGLIAKWLNLLPVETMDTAIVDSMREATGGKIDDSRET